jgi:hypothetical protein
MTATFNYTHADLVRMIGTENVLDGDVTVTDGGPEPGTTVFGRDPAMSLIILRGKEEAQPYVAHITFCQSPLPRSCRWHTSSGPNEIGFGTSLKTLERINGGPFRLYGFGWDYSGVTSSWSGGSLEHLPTDCPRLRMSVNARLQPGASKERQAYNKMQGEQEHWSSDPVMQVVNPVVYRFNVDFEGFNCGKEGQ